MPGAAATDRTVLGIGGADRARFLQGLVSNDVKPQGAGLSYAALLSPQGKYLADFFLLDQGEAILLDVKTDLAARLAQRLAMYRLRADVTIAESGLGVVRGLGPAPEGAWPDPRDPALGWRGYGMTPDAAPDPVDWDALRVALEVPETGIELIPEESFILEMGFDRLAGVDHRKGCYVGQEVTARMKHKTTLRKGLTRVRLEGVAVPGEEITDATGKPAGRLGTVAGDTALAHLRFDRGEGLRAGAARVHWPA